MDVPHVVHSTIPRDASRVAKAREDSRPPLKSPQRVESGPQSCNHPAHTSKESVMRLFLSAFAVLSLAVPVVAQQTAKAVRDHHVLAVKQGNVDMVMADYADDAV